MMSSEEREPYRRERLEAMLRLMEVASNREELVTDGGHCEGERPDSIPDGWTYHDGRHYDKVIKRAAVTVPNRYAGEPFDRDSVIVITETTVGVVKGPGARRVWQTDQGKQLAPALAETIAEWISNDGDPYGGSELNDRLDAVVTAATDEQVTLREFPT